MAELPQPAFNPFRLMVDRFAEKMKPFLEDLEQVRDRLGDEEAEGSDDNSDVIEGHGMPIPSQREVETLARDICDTYYLTVDPNNIMADAFGKITEKTRSHWRAQAALLIEKGWTNGTAADSTRPRTGKIHKSRW